jgi:hypothetical protein
VNLSSSKYRIASLRRVIDSGGGAVRILSTGLIEKPLTVRMKRYIRLVTVHKHIQNLKSYWK